MKKFLLLCAALCAPTFGFADDDVEPTFGVAGLFSRSNQNTLPEITLSSGMPLSDAPWELKSGGYYEVEITSDGSAELGLTGSGFFRAIWIDEIVIEGLEIRPLGLDSVEFDEPGTMEISFIALKPGTYTLQVPGSDYQKLEIIIE